MSRKQIQMRPGKGTSGLGFIVGIVFCMIGLFVVVPVFGGFGILWTLLAVGITAFHGMNTFSDHGIPTHEIIIEDEDSFRGVGYAEPKEEDRREGAKTAEERLVEAKGLLDSGLITEEDYEAKRKQILEEL